MEQRKQTNMIERRYANDGVEVRKSEDGSTVLRGYAAKFGSVYDMGWFTEELSRNAFANADMADVRILKNHDPNLILGRTKAGTARTWIDETGLGYEVTLPNSPDGENMRVAIERGDITQSSWGFMLRYTDQSNGDTWSRVNGKEHRVLEDVKIVFDASPVTFPANPDTTVAKRSFDAMHRSEEIPTPSEVKGEAINSVTSLIESLNEVVSECDEFINSAPDMAMLDSENAAMYTELAASCATVKDAAKAAIGLQAGFIANVNSQRNKILLVDMDLRLMEMQESL
jgi:hypothetical protein